MVSASPVVDTRGGSCFGKRHWQHVHSLGRRYRSWSAAVYCCCYL